MSSITAKDLEIYQEVEIGKYTGMKLTENNLFCFNLRSNWQFDDKKASRSNPRFAAHGCNIWKESDIRESLNGRGLINKLLSEELVYNINTTSVSSTISGVKTKTQDLYFLPSIEDTKTDWWTACMRTIMPFWGKTSLWLRDGKGETGTAYYNVDERAVKFSNAFTYKKVLVLCNVKDNTLFTEKGGLYVRSLPCMTITEENIPGIDLQTFTNFIK